MTPVSISSLNTALRGPAPNTASRAADTAGSVEEARVLKQAYSQFVGETFFGSMLKSMRQSVGEPAYFHGGMAEEQFQARLDQQMAADLASGQGSMFADSLFRHQFPQAAATLDAAARPAEADANTDANALDALNTLRSR